MDLRVDESKTEQEREKGRQVEKEGVHRKESAKG